MNDRLFIFDTTLRDGEQVPGCQLNTVEKIEVANQLETLDMEEFLLAASNYMNSTLQIKSISHLYIMGIVSLNNFCFTRI